MIKFQKLVINNFLSFGEKQILHLENRGVIRIEGRNLDDPEQDSNRAGKSAVLEAILWALFGKTVRGLKHNAVVNRFARRGCYVSVHFSVDNIGYKVTRYRKHSRKGNSLELFRGEKFISSRHETKTQSKLESILKVNFRTFTNSILFGGIRPFALLTDKEQKEILESFLHFERIDNALDRTKLERIRAEEKLASTQGGISVVKLKVSALQARLKALEESRKTFEEEKEQRLDAIARKLLKLKSLGRRSPIVKQKHEAATQRKERLIRKHSSWKYRVRELWLKIKKLKKLLRNKKSLLAQRCPVCGRVVTEQTLSGLLSHIRGDLKSLRLKQRVAKERLSSLERRLEYASGVESRLSKRFLQILSREREVRGLVREKKLLRTSHSPFSLELESARAKYSLCRSRLFVLEYEESILLKRIEDLKFWEEGFGNAGLKALVIREALPAMNEKLGEYSNEIFGNGVELRFVPSKTTKKGVEHELFHVDYHAKRGAPSYLAESAGGRKRVDICVLLTFAWVSRASNLLLLDELLDGLDHSGRQAVLRILARLRATVIVISHRRDVSSIGKVLTVTKKNGFSVLEKVA